MFINCSKTGNGVLPTTLLIQSNDRRNGKEWLRIKGTPKPLWYCLQYCRQILSYMIQIVKIRNNDSVDTALATHVPRQQEEYEEGDYVGVWVWMGERKVRRTTSRGRGVDKASLKKKNEEEASSNISRKFLLPRWGRRGSQRKQNTRKGGFTKHLQENFSAEMW